MAGKHRFRRIATLGEVLGRRARPSATTSGCTVGFADESTGVAHRVTAAEAFAADHRAGEPYIALCGARVIPARLSAPARYHCPVCEQGT
jgi:hypothetical protein